MKTHKFPRFLARNTLLLVVLAFASCFISAVKAKDLVVENGKITIPSTIIRGRYDDVFARQEIVRMEFVMEIESSPYEVEDVIFHTTDDGFVDYIFPKFSERFKTPQSQHRVLAFVRGDAEMEVYRTMGSETFMALVLRNDEELIRAPVLSAIIGGQKIPVIILVKTRSRLIST